MPPPATGSVPSLYCDSSIDVIHQHRTNSAQGSLITSDSFSGKGTRINERPRLVSHKHYWYIMDIYGRLPTWEIRLQRNVSTQDLMNGGSYCGI